MLYKDHVVLSSIRENDTRNSRQINLVFTRYARSNVSLIFIAKWGFRRACGLPKILGVIASIWRMEYRGQIFLEISLKAGSERKNSGKATYGLAIEGKMTMCTSTWTVQGRLAKKRAYSKVFWGLKILVTSEITCKIIFLTLDICG